MSYRVMTELAYDKWRERLMDTPVALCDEDAWHMYPNLRPLHNKLTISHLQGLEAYPHGIVPEKAHFPIFSKPIYNLLGCSTGSKVLWDWQDQYYQPSHFWMPLLTGPQYSTDLVLLDGVILWWYCLEPIQENRSFIGWQKVQNQDWRAVRAITDFVHTHLKNHTGPVNFETIGDKIIEAHPRCSAEFLDFFGDGWLDAVENLMATDEWDFHSLGKKQAYQGVYRTPVGTWNPIVDLAKVIKLENTTGIYSIFLPFIPGQPVNILNPDGAGTWRIAIVSGESSKIVNEVINELRKAIV